VRGEGGEKRERSRREEESSLRKAEMLHDGSRVSSSVDVANVSFESVT